MLHLEPGLRCAKKSRTEVRILAGKMAPSPHRRTIAEVGEFRLIDNLKRRFGLEGPSILKGIGDDAAVFRPLPGSDMIISTDMLVEGIHFNLTFESFHDVGYRAAVANLSDIAAMGGLPQYFLIQLAIPPYYAELDVYALYRGLASPSRQHGVSLIGGDSSVSPQGMFLGITVIGRIEQGQAIGRNGAEAGDLIYATGTLGDSYAGLQVLKAKTNNCKSQSVPHRFRYLINRHLHPTPRLQMGRLLSTNQLATAAIDLSDGLSGDLTRLCQASGVGAELKVAAIPLSLSCRAYAEHHDLDPVSFALEGGEDFELLFTVHPQNKRRLEHLVKKHRCRVTNIGTIYPKRAGIRLKLPNGSTRKMLERGYDHFAQSRKGRNR